MARAFSAHGRPLEMVTSVKYLGRMILAADNNWPAVVKILSRSWTFWRRILRILSREEVAPRVSGFFLNSVVQALLLFGSDTWMVTPHMGKSLGGFSSRWQDGWQDGSCGGHQMGSGNMPSRKWHRRRRESWWWSNASGIARTRSFFTLLRDHFYTCVRGWKGR